MSSQPVLRVISSGKDASTIQKASGVALSVVAGTGGPNPLHFAAPGRVADFARLYSPDAGAANWHKTLARHVARYRDFPRVLHPKASAPVTCIAGWTGFPRGFDTRLDVGHHPERMGRAHRSAEMLTRYVPVIYRSADGDTPLRLPAHFASGIALYPEASGMRDMSRPFDLAMRPQDEFLEWHTVRDALGRVIRIDFTTELPEYWQSLAESGPAEMVERYESILKTAIDPADLVYSGGIFRPIVERGMSGLRVVSYELMPGVEAGAYNPLNRWNTSVGAVHMTHSSNTLSALLNVVALSSLDVVGAPQDASAAALAAAGGFGDANRGSDPVIARRVQGLVRAGNAVGLSDPVGLYVDDVDLGDFRDPTGAIIAPEEVLTFERGRPGSADELSRVVRFSIRPPAGVDYGLESCSLNGHPLVTGGAVARATRVALHLACKPSKAENVQRASRAGLATHPSRQPQQFMAIAHGAPVPAADDPRWDDGPALAPDLGSLMRAVEAAGQSARLI